MSYASQPRPLAGIVLAGGQGARIGGRKHLRRLHGQTLLELALRRLGVQVDSVLLSCNEDAVDAPRGVLAVLHDSVDGQRGPLAGVLAGLEYLAQRPVQGAWLLSVPVDTPAFPEDLAGRLCNGLGTSETRIAVACSPGGEHPVFALWSVSLAPALREWLESGADYSVRAFQRHIGVARVRWESDLPFHNINTAADLERFEAGARP